MTTHRLHRSFVTFALIGAIAAMTACSSDSTSPARGTMVVHLTDAPFSIDSVSRVDIFVVRVDGRIAAADSAAADSGATSDSASAHGWQTLASPNASVNLLEYQNGTVLGLGSASVAAGSYQGFRLVIDPSRSSVTLSGGLVLTGTSNPNVSFPSGSTSGLKVNLSSPIVVAANDTTTLLLDFNVDSSFVVRGNSITQNGLLFKPVIRASVH